MFLLLLLSLQCLFHPPPPLFPPSWPGYPGMGPFLKQKMLIARRVLLGGRLRLQSRRAAHLYVGGGGQSVRPGPSLARAVAEDEHYMRLALDEARVARDLGEVPVGAVLVDDEGEVMARAHNTVETSTDPTAHAEMLCLRQASKRLESWRLLEVSWTPTPPPRRRGELGTDARKTPGTPSLSRRPRSSSHWSLVRCEYSFPHTGARPPREPYLNCVPPHILFSLSQVRRGPAPVQGEARGVGRPEQAARGGRVLDQHIELVRDGHKASLPPLR